MERRRAERERAARAKAMRDQEKAAARERYLSGLAGREEELWTRIDELVAAKKAGAYDEAVGLLADVRDLGMREGRQDETEERILAFREQYASRTALLRRLDQAGLGTSRSRVGS